MNEREREEDHPMMTKHPCGCTSSTTCPDGERIWNDVRVYLRDYTPEGDTGYMAAAALYHRHFTVATTRQAGHNQEATP